MDSIAFKNNRTDLCIASMISIFLLLICAAQLTYGMPNWGGDDFAAYINEGIAISTGTFKDQTVRNLMQHPSPLPSDASADNLVYVWGFPLLLSLVHRLVGFDMVNYSTFIYYKIPSLLAYSLMAGILYLYYRRFFSRYYSAFLSLFFCSSQDLLQSVNLLNVDMPFLCICLVTLLLSEYFFCTVLENHSSRNSWLLALGLGFSFWFTYETRLNGNTILIITAFSHILRLIRQKVSVPFRQLWIHLFPYLLFVFLKIASESLLLPATSNLSDVGNLTAEMVGQNILYYWKLTTDYWQKLSGSKLFPFWIFLGITSVVGLVRQGFSEKHLHLTVLLFGTYLVLILLPYTQGLRYIFNILPIWLLFSAHGGQYIWNRIAPKLKISKKAKQILLFTLAILLLCHVYAPWLHNGISNLQNGRQLTDEDIYSSEAIEMYRYIQQNVADNEIIAFQKPRALYLNTGKNAFAPNINGHHLDDADYFLASIKHFPFTDVYALEQEGHKFTLLYENSSFSLYKRN